MRVALSAVCIATLLALPAGAQESKGSPQGPAPQVPVTTKISLRHQNSTELLTALLDTRAAIALGLRPTVQTGAGYGDVQLLTYPRENSLLVRGTQSVTAEFAAALAVVDVPMETAGAGQSVTLKLRRSRPEAVRAAALRLPGAGRITGEGETLRLEGDAGWIRTALGVVFRSEYAPDAPAATHPPRRVSTGPQGMVKVNFRHQDAASWLPVARAGVREGIEVVPIPQHNALALRGDAGALGSAGAALAAIDVPVETVGGEGRVQLTLERADPTRVEATIRGLAQAGRVRVEGRTLTCEGSRTWLRGVLLTVLKAELAGG